VNEPIAPSLYITPIEVDEAGDVKTFPAAYLRNQENVKDWNGWGNHTPASDVFAIEPAVLKYAASPERRTSLTEELADSTLTELV
jgi:hypothetical protein